MTRPAIALALTGLCLTDPVHAHYLPDTPALEVGVSLVSTWRSDDQLGNQDYWQVPGTLMGGHAWPHDKGVSIDELSIDLGARINERTFGVIEIGSHGAGHDEGAGVELQHAYLGYVCCNRTGPWVIEGGRMGAAFSPSLAGHAASRLASEAPLTSDVFFGRDFHDEGVRLWWHETHGWSAGAEVWRGKAFPASVDGDAAWDAFARYTWQRAGTRATLGGWYYQASPQNRTDHRYGDGHQHSGGLTPVTFANVGYSGDVRVAGLHTDLGYQLAPDWYIGLQGELMHVTLDGRLHDDSGRQAQLDADQIGGWLQPYVTWRRHTLGVRAERISTDNHLTGAAAPALAQGSGLANPESHDPARYSAIWRWQWRDDLALRAELIHDESLVESDLRWTLGVIWQGRLWPGGGSTAGTHRH